MSMIAGEPLTDAQQCEAVLDGLSGTVRIISAIHVDEFDVFDVFLSCGHWTDYWHCDEKGDRKAPRIGERVSCVECHDR